MSVKPYELRVALAVASVDLAKYGAISFLVERDGDDIRTPQRTLYAGQRAEDLAGQIFKRLTGWDAHPWISLRQVGFFDSAEDGTAIVLYGATVPEMLPLVDANAAWADPDTLMAHPDVYGLASLAVNYTARGK
jgi:hypothetical protein